MAGIRSPDSKLWWVLFILNMLIFFPLLLTLLGCNTKTSPLFCSLTLLAWSSDSFSPSPDLGQISLTNCCKVCTSIRGVLKCDLQPALLCQQKPLVWIKTYQQKCSFTGWLSFFSQEGCNKLYQHKWSFPSLTCNWSINTLLKCSLSIPSYLIQHS